jgi:hypothetical protein
MQFHMAQPYGRLLAKWLFATPSKLYPFNAELPTPYRSSVSHMSRASVHPVIVNACNGGIKLKTLHVGQ